MDLREKASKLSQEEVLELLLANQILNKEKEQFLIVSERFQAKYEEEQIKFFRELEENKSIQDKSKKQEVKLSIATEENKDLQGRIEELERQNEWFRRQLFGRKSERRILVSSEGQLCLGEILDVDDEPPAEGETVKSYQRRQRRKQPLIGAIQEEGLQFDESVPIEEIELSNPDIEGLDRSAYEIVSETVTYRLAQQPGSYKVLKYIRKVAKLKETGKLVRACAPESVLEKSYADVSFLAGMLVDKFCWHLPLYRQHQRLFAAGIRLNRGTLTNLVRRTVDLLEPVYYSMFSSILQSKVLTMDETPIKATREKEKHRMRTGWFWPVYGDRDEIAFVFSLSRAGPVVKEVLGTFSGVLVSDGYKVYDSYAGKVEGLTHAQCWAHTRRKFEQALDAQRSISEEALDHIGRLYDVERDIRRKELTGEARVDYRVEHSLPIVDVFFSRLRETLTGQALLPHNPFTKAARYALDREDALRVFLYNGDVPVDTNHIERQIRPLAVGRKNWLFCWTETGAHHAGIANSLIASCRLQGIDPYVYFTDVLQRISTHPAFDVHKLTPRLWKKHFAEKPLRSDSDHRKNQ